MVIIVFGLPGSGKTWFAKTLAARIKAVYISTDQLRNSLIRDIGYTPEEKTAVYSEMLRRTQDLILRENADVVLDGTFSQTASRRLFRSALETDTPLFFVEITADDELIRQRLQHPREDSNAGVEVYEQLAADWQPENDEHLVLRSGQDNLEDMLRQAMHHLNIIYDKNQNPCER